MRRLLAEVAPLPVKIRASFSVALMYCLIAWRASSLAKIVCLPLADCMECVLAYIGMIVFCR